MKVDDKAKKEDGKRIREIVEDERGGRQKKGKNGRKGGR